MRQRFYRLPNSPGHGSGLGLAIVEEIAALYGASVTLDSGAHGRGTLVPVQFKDSASFPRIPSAAARAPLTLPPRPGWFCELRHGSGCEFRPRQLRVRVCV